MVISAVYDLVKNSNELVRYVNDTVMPDYDGFVESGKQYRDDAVHVNQTVVCFNNMSDDLSTYCDFAKHTTLFSLCH